MMLPDRPITEEELHAYVDGGLDRARRLHIAVYLASHPVEAARTEAFRAQKEGIRALFDHVLDQPVPDRLRRMTFKHAARSTLRRCAMAAVIGAAAAMLILGGRSFTDRIAFLRDSLLTAPATARHEPTGYPVIPPMAPSVKSSRADDI